MCRLLSVGVIAMLVACASFEQHEVAKVDELPDVSQYQNKPSVFVDLAFYSGSPNAGNAVALAEGKKLLMPHVKEVIEGSELFSEITYDEFEKDKVDYELQVAVYNHGTSGAGAVLAFLSGFTFGVIPAVATDNYTVDVKLMNTPGKLLREERNKDSVTTWIGLWFIPFMGYTPEKAVFNTINNQVRAALKELIESGAMKYSENGYFALPRPA